MRRLDWLTLGRWLVLALVPMACAGMEAVEGNQAAVTTPISITGKVTSASGAAFSGVTLTLAGSSQAVKVSDVSGQYRFDGLQAGLSYSVKPTRAGCAFTPDVVNLNNLSASKVQNFVAAGAACQPPSATVLWNDSGLVLTARRIQGTSVSEDAERALSKATRILIPATLPVTLGNAGTGTATLLYRTATGESRCEYRGGSPVAHPSTPVAIAQGLEYRLVGCWDGGQAGDVRSVTWVKLHVESGDRLDLAGVTEVRVRLGDEGFQELEPPLSRVESVTLRETFRWASTNAVPETNSEGKASLWYALIYVDSKDAVEALGQLYIHHSSLPLFNAEQTRWRGRRGVFTNQGDGKGNFVFAVIPGITYNLIREAALEGNEIFQAIIMRQPPADSRNPDGSLSHAALKRSAFAYEADLSIVIPDDPTVLPSVVTLDSEVAMSGFLNLIRGVIKVIAKTVNVVVDGIQKGFGVVDRWAGGAVNVTTGLDVRNTDPAFGGEIVDTNDKSTPFLRTWGADRGKPAPLPGVRFEIRHIAGLGIETLFTGRTGADGITTIKVAKDRDSYVCVDVENDAALVTPWLLPVKMCDFASRTYSADTSNKWKVRSKYINVLMQASEARAYMTTIIGQVPAKASIMVDSPADLIGWINGRAAFSPCFSFPNDSFDSILDSINALLTFVPVVGNALSVALAGARLVYQSADIIIPAGGDVGEANLTSRGTAIHEYGHFALCNLMFKASPLGFAKAYTDAMLTQLMAGSSPEASDTAAYLNESFANLFSAQVAGGVGYFNPDPGPFPWTAPGPYVWSQYMYYCSGTNVCLDTDRHDRFTYDDQIARVTTTLHDAFDGHTTGTDTPGNADVWTSSDGTNILYATAPYITSPDESVALPGSGMATLFSKWARRGITLTEESFLGGLADTITDAGYSWCDACDIFARHEKGYSATNPRQTYDKCSAAPISNWLASKPDPNDPTSCTYAAYFKGCGSGGNTMCDEMVDSVYFTNHPGCARNTVCGGVYESCGATCPVPSGDEIPNIKVKASGVAIDNAQILVGYDWSGGGTGGFANVTLSGPWSELQFGIGMHAPATTTAAVMCARGTSVNSMPKLITVVWRDGSMQNQSCTSDSCWLTALPVKTGFTATCTFVTTP